MYFIKALLFIFVINLLAYVDGRRENMCTCTAYVASNVISIYKR